MAPGRGMSRASKRRLKLTKLVVMQSSNRLPDHTETGLINVVRVRGSPVF